MALASDEVPVGCVFVHNGQIIGKGMNDTNRSLNVNGLLTLQEPIVVSDETIGHTTCRIHWHQ